MKTLYHGTGSDRLKPILRDGLMVLYRHYVGTKAACTTLNFKIAVLFALRRSPPSILKGDLSDAGVVLEYELSSGAGKGSDWDYARDDRSLQDEQEVAVFRTDLLKPVAVWKMVEEGWARNEI